MNVRKFKSDKNALIAEGNRIVSSSDDAKFIRKVTIVNRLPMPLAKPTGLFLTGSGLLMSMGLRLSVHANSLGVRNPLLIPKKKILKSS